MKQKYRKRALDEVLARLGTRDFDTREYALFQLALILDRSNHSGDAAELPDYYAANLPRELLRLRLTDAEQAQVASAVSRLAISNSSNRATAIWTLSKVRANLGLSSLAEIVSACGSQLENADALLLCDALCNCFDSTDDNLQILNRSTRDSLLAFARCRRRQGDERLKGACNHLIKLLETHQDVTPDAADQ